MTLRFTEAEFELFRKKGSLFGGGKKSSAKKRSKAVNVSAHAQALAALAKKPESEKGKQEHYLQVRVFDYFERKHPEIYEHLAAYPAGGHRGKKAAFEMKAEGQQDGYPDIIMDLPSGQYHGARIEVKTATGSLQTNQKRELKRLHDIGYYCTARKGFEAVVEAILSYYRLQSGEALEPSQLDEKWLNYQEDKE